MCKRKQVDKLGRMFFCAIFILSGLLARPIAANDVWLEPNAWEIHSPSANTCPVCDIPDVSNESGITTMYYKKMIAELFNRSTLKFNPKNGHLERTIILSLTPAQLKIIENASDIRDYNSVVMAVLKSVKEPVGEQVEEQSSPKNNESSFWLLKYMWELLYSSSTHIVKIFSYTYFYSSEVRFAIIVCAVMLAVWFIHKEYNKNLILIFIVFLIMFGYFFTYIECNRKLEADKFIKFVEETEPDDPSYLSKILGYFFTQSKKDQKIVEIKNTSKLKLSYCRPDDVAIMYFNEIFFNQLQVITIKIVESMNIIQNTIPFPFNYMGMIALPFLFMSLLPLLFQYIFNPVLWSKVFRDLSAKHHQTNELINNNAHQVDRLSGDNLKMLIEVLKNKTEVEQKSKNSAVEDVKDLPQPITAAPDDSLSAEEASEDKSFVRIDDILEEEDSKKES